MEKKYLLIDEKYKDFLFRNYIEFKEITLKANSKKMEDLKELDKKETKLERDEKYCLENCITKVDFEICMKKRGWKVENI